MAKTKYLITNVNYNGIRRSDRKSKFIPWRIYLKKWCVGHVGDCEIGRLSSESSDGAAWHHHNRSSGPFNGQFQK